MSKRLLSIFLVFTYTHTVLFAQLIDHANLQDLQQSLLKCPTEDCKIPILLNIANTYIVKPGEFITDLDSALQFANQAALLNKSVRNSKYEGLYDFVYSKYFHEKKNIPAAEDMGRKAVDIFVKANYPEEAGDVLMDMSYYYRTDVDSTRWISIGLCNRAAEYFNKAKALQKKASAYERLADIYVLAGEYQRGIDTLKVALSYNKVIHLNNLEGIYRILGSVYSILGNYEDAISYLFLSLKITEDTKDNKGIAVSVYNQIGLLYFNVEDYSDAEVYFKKALDLADSANLVDDIQLIANNIINTMCEAGQLNEALQFQSYINKKYTYPDSDLYNNMYLAMDGCTVYDKMNKPDLMEPYAKRLEALCNRVQVNSDYKDAYNELASYFIASKNLKAAKKYIDIFTSVATNTSDFKSKFYLQYLMDSARQDYKKALQSFKSYTAMNDSMIKEKTQKQLTQTKIKYQTEQKDQEIISKQKDIVLLSSEDKINKLNLKNTTLFKNILIAGAGVLIFLLILIYSRFRLKNKTNRQLQSKQVLIHKQNIELQSAMSEKDKLLIEKEWLVKEIHHRVKNNLQIMISLLRMQTNYLEDGEAIRAIGESRHRLQAISLLHQKLYRADQLELINMEAYIKDLITYLKDSFDGLKNLRFNMNVEAVKLQVSHAIPIGLIINEAVTNAVKYAFPGGRNGTIEISLLKENQTISLIIKDNGIGLNTNIPEDEIKSMGMRLIQILADQIGGSLNVFATNGVSIEISSIPYEDILHPALNKIPLSAGNLV